jgi:uncharacterized protein
MVCVNDGRKFIGRFSCKSDLLGSLTQFCKDNNITLGVFSIIGAVTKASLGYYDQDKKQYLECVSISEKLEIVSCSGNISQLDNDVFVHAHIQLADHKGHCYGGHLMPGTLIFAAEYYITEYKGARLLRKNDSQTGLQLWPE